jgi:hypothetical protein
MNAMTAIEIVHDNVQPQLIQEEEPEMTPVVSKEMNKLPSKYTKQSHLLFWFLNELAQKGAINTEKYNELLEYTMIFNPDVAAQATLYEKFEQESANVAKAIKSQLRERKQSEKKTLTKKPKAEKSEANGVVKRGRKKTPVCVVSDNQNDIIADLVKLANEDVEAVVNGTTIPSSVVTAEKASTETSKPKRKYVRKAGVTVSVVPVTEEGIVSDEVKPKRKYVRKNPTSSPEAVASEAVVSEAVVSEAVVSEAVVSEAVVEQVKPKRKYVRKSPVSSPKSTPSATVVEVSVAIPAIAPAVVEEPIVVPAVVAEEVKPKRKYVRKTPVSSPKSTPSTPIVEVSVAVPAIAPVVVEEPAITPVIEESVVKPVVVAESELSMESFVEEQEDEDEDMETLILSQFISNGQVTHLIDPKTNELYDLEGNELVGVYDPITKKINPIAE